MMKAVEANRMNPGHGTPNRSRKKPSSNGGKKPPSPPMALTNPVTVPVSFWKYCGTNLNTAPLPKPIRAAQPRAPTVNGKIDGQDSNSANGINPKNTAESTRAPPILSDNHPPIGRSSVASTTNPPVRSPASAVVRPNSSLSKLGR